MTALDDRIASRGGERSRTLALVGSVVALVALVGYAFEKDRHALRLITQACVIDARWTGWPFPCLKVDLQGGEDGGYVILRAPYLHDTVFVPTRKVVGVEDSLLSSPAAPNYFEKAWGERSNVKTPDGGTPAHDRRLLVVNSGVVRTQDQLHVHIGCQKPTLRRNLASIAPALPVGTWRFVGPIIPHHPFWALRIGRADLGAADPFQLAFEEFGGAIDDPAQLTVGVAGVTVEGQDDLVVLASYAHAPGTWWPVGAEELLDTRCWPEPPP